MAFPTTGILDTFNRANGPLGANWSVLAGGLVVSSNTCAAGGGGTDASQWAVSTFGPNVEGFWTLAVQPAGGTAGISILRSGTFDGYGSVWGPAATQLRIQRFDGGVGTDLASTTSFSLSVGDALGYWLNGTTHQCWARLSGVWTFMLSATDSTHTGFTDYRHMVSIFAGTGAVDDFGGGNEVPEPPPEPVTATVAWVTA